MSEFLQRKHRSYFRRYDVNGDGFLTREDYELLADRFCEDEAPDSLRRKTVREKYTQFYALIESLGSTPGKVCEEEWIEALSKAVNTPEFKKALSDGIDACFMILDSDGDGFIDEKEYIRFLRHQQVADYENAGKKAFKILDLNGDGVLSSDEFHEIIVDFFCSEDESRPGTFFLGPLI